MAQALEGVKIVGFTVAGVGPIIERILGSFGATVVRIESEKYLDLIRVSGPFKDNIPGVNRSIYFASFNANKYSFALDVKNPKSQLVKDRLIKWADIVLDNWVPGTLEKWGIGYEYVRKLKPNIIMCRNSNQGQTGPESTRRGYGLQLEALAGFEGLTGWPDDSPQTCHGYTDFAGATVATSAILTALIHRDKTGQGQLIDVAQYEVGANFLGPCFLDYFVNGNERQRMGNSSPDAAPHGAYRCLGEDRWCDITIFTDDEWQSFSKAIGNPPWTKESKFTTTLSRKQNEVELDKYVERWTVNHAPEEVMNLLQARGVAAGVVEDIGELFRDPQLKARHFLEKAEHPIIGPVSHILPSIEMSRTPPSLRLPGPCLGEHTLYVCKKLLGMSDEEIDELTMANVFV